MLYIHGSIPETKRNGIANADWNERINKSLLSLTPPRIFIIPDGSHSDFYIYIYNRKERKKERKKEERDETRRDEMRQATLLYFALCIYYHSLLSR